MCASGRLEHWEQEERAPDSLPPTRDAATVERERAELHAHVADGVIVADTAGRIVFANETACRLLGMNLVGETLERYLGGGHLVVRDGRVFPPVDQSVPCAALASESGSGNELRVRRADGTEVNVQSDATPLAAADGSRFGVVLTLCDRTERQQAGEERARLAAIVESSEDAIIGKTLDGIITSWNPGAERLYGYSVAEVLGRSLDIIIPPDHADDLPAILERLRRGERIKYFETVRVRKDGRRLDVSLSISPVQDASGRIVGAATIARDITERKRAEAERRQHEREMTTRVLAAQEAERKRIARELHDETAQALSTLLINLDLLEPYIPEECTVLQSGCKRVRALARRALEETRAFAHDLRPAILDDVGLVGALPGLGQQCTETYGVPVQVDVDTPPMGRLPPEVEVALFRIAQEALTNIGKHAAARSARVALALQEGTARLVVQDDGKGFDLEQVRRPTRQGGLGLYGLHERVALLGGTLALDTAPGQGVRLTVTVPLQGKSESLPSPGQPSKRRGTRTHVGIKVLLVDDHAVVREGLRMALDAQPGITVLGEAEDGRQALELIEELRPEVVVMDIAMPNMNGLEATRQSKRRFPDVKVVILTMYEDEGYVAQIVEAGANGCVVKRSAGTELLLALHAAMRGERYFSPSIARILVEGYGKQLAPTDRIGRLTEREREVLQLVAEGKTNKDIAELLVLSIKTVKVHRAHIMEKLGVHDRMDLVKRATRMGLVMTE
jgi:PAS domain S-box-containing protein